MNLWIPARELSIALVEDPQYWKWTHHSSCSSEVAELIRVCWLEITGKVNARSLPVKSSYSAFLVFKLHENESNSELEKATASVRFINEISDKSGHGEGYTVFIDKKAASSSEKGRFPRLRRDGWSEIKLGEFFNNSGEDGDVEMRLLETDEHKWKSGLMVRGVEVRPNIDVLSIESVYPTLVSPRMCIVYLFCLIFYSLSILKVSIYHLLLFCLIYFFLSSASFR